MQALYLLNDPFVHEQSRRVAERLATQVGDDAARIRRGYELLFARLASTEELAAGKTFLAQARAQLRDDGMTPEQVEPETWRAFVRVLFRLNEFVYVD